MKVIKEYKIPDEFIEKIAQGYLFMKDMYKENDDNPYGTFYNYLIHCFTLAKRDGYINFFN